MLNQLRHVPGIADARIQQAFDYPSFDVAVDRTKAAQSGLSERDVANSVLNSLSGSFQITPMFFLNWQNGVNYNLVAADAAIRHPVACRTRRTFPISAGGGKATEILGDVATIKPLARNGRSISHYNIRRVVDIYGSVQDRDLGAVGRDITRIVDANRKHAAARQLRDRARPARDDAQLLHQPAGRPRLRDRAGLSADRRELPVLARSVHHHHGAAGGAGRHRAVPVLHRTRR